MEHGDEENTPAQIPLYNTPQNIQEFAYQERTLVKYNKFVIVIAIFGVIVFGTMIPVFAKGTFGQNDKEAGIYIVIGLVCGFILFELFIQFFALGLKVCIDNLNKTISFKRIGLYSCKCCCGSHSFKFSEVNNIVYDIEKGFDGDGAYIIVNIFVTLRDTTNVSLYNMKVSGSCVSESRAGIPEDIHETIPFINNLLNEFNSNIQ